MTAEPMKGHDAIKKSVNLRAIEPEDLDALYQIENDADTWGVGVTSVPYSRYVLRDYVAHVSNDIYADRQVRFVIENETGAFVGLLDLVNFDPQHCRAEVSIVVQKAFRRQGYARLALQQLSRYALRVLHLHQLYGVADADNAACIELFQSEGYQTTARLRDWLYNGKTYHDAVLLQFNL